MKSSNGPSWMLRWRALTIPTLTELPSPSALPIAKTGSPTRTASLSANFSTGSRRSEFTFKSARSQGLTPTTAASSTVLSWSVTVTVSALSTTCLLVTIKPLGSTMKPVPSRITGASLALAADVAPQSEGCIGCAAPPKPVCAVILTTPGNTPLMTSAKPPGLGTPSAVTRFDKSVRATAPPSTEARLPIKTRRRMRVGRSIIRPRHRPCHARHRKADRANDPLPLNGRASPRHLHSGLEAASPALAVWSPFFFSAANSEGVPGLVVPYPGTTSRPNPSGTAFWSAPAVEPEPWAGALALSDGLAAQGVSAARAGASVAAARAAEINSVDAPLRVRILGFIVISFVCYREVENGYEPRRVQG